MLKYLLLFLSASCAAFLLTPLVRSLARKSKAYDLPNWRKVHGGPIPRLGGLAIFASFYLVLLLSYQFDFFNYPPNFLREIRLGWLLLATLIIFATGAVDDYHEIPAGVKIVTQTIAALIVASTNFRIEMISLPWGHIYMEIWAIPVTVLWIVAITNALNLLDGLDGLAAGTSLIVCLSVFGISILNQNIGIALLSVILAGGILGFLRYNFHPASIFLGNSGAYTLGFTLSILSLQGNSKGSMTVIFLVPIIILGLPIMDTALSMVRRLMNSLHILEVDHENNVLKFLFFGGRSIFKADRDHIHHRLLRMGFTHRNAVVFLYCITLLLGALAFASVYFQDINQALFIAAIGAASYIGVQRLGYHEIQFLRNGSLLPIFDLPIIGQRILKVLVDMGCVALSYYLAFLLRFEGELDPATKEHFLATIPLVLAVKVMVFNLVGFYRGPWRYINVDEILRMLKGVILGCVALGFLLWILPYWEVRSWSVLFIHFNLLFLLIAGTRSSFRILEYLHLSNHNGGKKVLLYGIGKSSVHALNELIDNPRLKLSPVGFIDDDPRNLGKNISGYPILGTLDSLDTVLGNRDISEIIVAQDELPREKVERLSEICSSRPISLRRFCTRLERIPED